MNSILEVSKNIIAIIGSEKPSEFRLNQLRRSILLEEAKNINYKEIYFCHLNIISSAISHEELSGLSQLVNGSDEDIDLEKRHLFITPRIGTISPWSSKATEILKNCNLDFINRVERGYCYFVSKDINPLDLRELGNSLADKMTQEVLLELKEIPKLFSDLKPQPLSDVDLSLNNQNALHDANSELGLALSDEEISYLYESYSNTNKDPTDAELMMFAQANSEHCRHKIFNADWTIDGKEQSISLFDMIRNTYRNSSKGEIGRAHV